VTKPLCSIEKRRRRDARFWARVDRAGPVLRPGLGPCWTWSGATGSAGYGRVRRAGRLIGVHRLIYQMFVGPIRSGLCLCHRCDNPPCCNPAHLFLGTNLDNSRDMVMKQRHRYGPGSKPECGGPRPAIWGIRHYNAKLTDEQILEIRRATGASERAVARLFQERFGVARSCVRAIRAGMTWRHVS